MFSKVVMKFNAPSSEPTQKIAMLTDPQIHSGALPRSCRKTNST